MLKSVSLRKLIVVKPSIMMLYVLCKDRQRMPNGIGTTALDLSEQVSCNTNGGCTSNTGLW